MTLARLAWPGPGAPTASALRARLEAEGFHVRQWTDVPGSTYTPHSHDHDECIWCVQGEITFGVAGEEIRLGAGDRLMLPGGTVHTARAGPLGASYLIGER